MRNRHKNRKPKDRNISALITSLLSLNQKDNWDGIEEKAPVHPGAVFWEILARELGVYGVEGADDRCLLCDFHLPGSLKIQHGLKYHRLGNNVL